MADTGSQNLHKTFAEAEQSDWFSRVIKDRIVEGFIEIAHTSENQSIVFFKIREQSTGRPIGITGQPGELLVEEIGKHRRRVLEHRAKGKTASSGLSKADRDSARLIGPHVQPEMRKDG